MNYHLALVKNPKKADIALSTGVGGTATYAIKVEVPSNTDKTHPYVHRDVVKAIYDSTGGKVKIGVYDMRCVVAVRGWNSGDNFYYRSAVGNVRNQYSEACINWLKTQVKKNHNFFLDCREHASHCKLFSKNTFISPPSPQKS